MPIATIDNLVELQCPWCGAKATPAVAKVIADRFKISDLGRDNMKTGACPICGKTIGVVLKYIYYKVVQVP